MIYSHMDDRGRVVTIRDAQASVTAPRHDGGLHVVASGSPMVHISDDEIPNLISALQAYMSRRAREVTREAKSGR